jgi:hypothetical protein
MDPDPRQKGSSVHLSKAVPRWHSLLKNNKLRVVLDTFVGGRKVLSQIAVSWAISTGAAVTIYSVFKFLSNFQPLTNAALDWLTNPRSDAFLARQYLAIRSRLFGSKTWSLRRALAVSIPFLVVFLALAIVHQIPSGETARSLHSLIFMGAKIFSIGYFRFWEVMPAQAVAILASSYLIALLSFAAFDRMTRVLLTIVKRPPVYFLAFFATIFGLYSMLLFLSCFPVAIFLSSRDDNAVSTFMAGLTMWPTLITEFTTPVTEADDAGLKLGIGFAVLIAIIGTATILFAAVLMSIILNLIYSAALIVGRIEIFVRMQLGWRQSKIYDAPVEYIGHIASALTFCITLLGCALWFTLSRSMNFP